MPGFLDPLAPDSAAEYTRYVDGDLLGKLVAKNVLTNAIGNDPQSIFIPLGRYGDAKTRYDASKQIMLDRGDGHVETTSGNRVTFEIKAARINIANRFKVNAAENWAFTGLLRSPAKTKKQYDILIAIGISVRGLEDDKYWSHLNARHNLLLSQGHSARLEALPHEADFLSNCGFFFIPRVALKHNFFRVNIDTISKSPLAKYYAKGHDWAQCNKVWNAALAVATANEA